MATTDIELDVPAVPTDDGRAYGRTPGQSDLELTQVGAGTPSGELLRRYWHPIALSSEATSIPRDVRMLGEDLILYRTLDGTPGLLEPRCCHRGTTLLYAKVESDCIRCSYHGWSFAADGTCLDQPCEPDRGRNRGSYRQPWYPVVEFGGLIFTYMGPPEKQPVFPVYDIFQDIADDEELVTFDRFAFGGPNVAPCNWFQTHENAMDPYHVFILHNAISGPQFDPRLEIWPTINFQRHDWGVTATQDRKLPDGTTLHRVTEIRVPTVRVIPTPTLAYLGKTNNMSWTQPIDDTHTRVFAILRIAKGSEPQGLGTYGPDERAWEDLSEEEHRLYPGDYETQVGQGPVTLHSEERLSSTDRGVSLVRRQFKEQVRIVAEGGDPIGVTFADDPSDAPDSSDTESVSLIAGNYIIDDDTDLFQVPVSETLVAD